MKKYLKVRLVLGISLIFLTGCAVDLVVPENDVSSPASEGSSAYENPAGGLSTGKGTLKLYLTDAPGDYQEVNINISRIEGHIAGDVEKSSWETLKEWPAGLLVDLIKLEDVSILLGSLQLAPNKYTQLRIFLKEEATLLLVGEVEPVPLEIPSSANTGIKLNRPFEIIAGMITKLTIDFDAEKSVIKTGNGKYKMKPVISVSSETYSSGELPEGVGTVVGNVSYYESTELKLIGIAGANIELTGGAYIFANTTTTSGEVDLEGSFSLINVPAGTYTLNVVAEGYDNYSESEVIVTAGTDTPVDVVFLTELPGAISGSVVISGTTDAIEGATVTVTLAGGSTYSFERSTETDSFGVFSIGQLPVGLYELSVSAVNFGVYDDTTPGGISVTAGVDTPIGTIGLVPIP